MSDVVGGRGIGCQIGRTSPRSCCTGQGVAHRSMSEMSARELRVLAAAGGVETHSNRNWLPVAELRSSKLKVLEPSTEVGFNQKCVLTLFVFVNEFECLSHGAML